MILIFEYTVYSLKKKETILFFVFCGGHKPTANSYLPKSQPSKKVFSIGSFALNFLNLFKQKSLISKTLVFWLNNFLSLKNMTCIHILL